MSAVLQHRPMEGEKVEIYTEELHTVLYYFILLFVFGPAVIVSHLCRVETQIYLQHRKLISKF